MIEHRGRAAGELASLDGVVNHSDTATHRAPSCTTADPELFFAESPAHVEEAKGLCLGCSLRAECLAGALDRREPSGVWGGELFPQGGVIPRKRPRGRPRKDAAAA